MLSLLHYLQSIHPITPEAQQYLGKVLRKKELRKNAFWLKQGETCNRIAFIEKGMVKIFFESGNKEIAIWYNKEDDVMISVKSFFFQMPSQLAIKAVEPTTLYYIEYAELQGIYQSSLDFNVNGRKILEHYYSTLEEHTMMMAKPPKERYDDLVRLYPWMNDSKRFKDYMLAAYLGIDRTTLSRYKNGK